MTASDASQPALVVRIPGRVVANNPADDTDRLQIQTTYRIAADTRGDDLQAATEKLDQEKLIELHFDDDDGTVWLGDFSNLDEIFPTTAPKLRAATDAGIEPVLDLPTDLTVGEPNRSGIVQKVALKLVKIFVKKAVEDDADAVIHKLANRFEGQQLHQGLDVTQTANQEGNLSGLFRLSSDFQFVAKEQEGLLADGHYLLFLHGTASSTLGSFDKLRGTMAWDTMRRVFTVNKVLNVLAYEHETLTKSPLDNVLDLVQRLPAKATLTLISHSRGGLVGDTLNRFFAGDPDNSGFSAKEKDFLRKQGRTTDIARIEAIEAIVRTKNIRIERFIRVACTASGTTLASSRLDIYMNVLLNVLGLAVATTGPFKIAYGIFRDLLSELIKTRNDASVLPGLEVQNPASAFNQMLNNAAPDTLIQTPLVVISGDAELSLRWKAVRVALINLFFLGDNDFVVDTRSMYNGAKRADNGVQYFFDQSPDVSHFGYFENERTRNMLQVALETPPGQPIPGFTKLDNRAFSTQEIRNIDLGLPGGRVFQDEVSGKKPIVVLLPGIMGSTLTVKDERVWINYLGFVTGSLTNLEHTPENNLNVRADGLMASSYRKLVEYLKREYDVVTFPFDWRTGMADNAAKLNQKLLDLMKHRQPVKLIGHSMGGVLIRDFAVQYAQTWELLNGSRDFRLVFLGTPLRGSFRIPYVLFGLDSLISTLDTIDVTHTRKDLLAVFSRFPGILSLLPLDTDNPLADFARPQVWEDMRDAFGETDWPLPPAELLGAFGAYRAHVNECMDTLDLSRAVYVAGQGRSDQQTISGYRIVKLGSGQRLQFLATKEGDESVTWASIPNTLVKANSVYYSDVPHGELANEPRLFAAISDLLRTGSTAQLRQIKPTVRGLDTEFNAKHTFNFNLSSDGVEKTLLGLGVDNLIAPSDVPIAVTVSNGHLKYARYPIMAGHFENDGIMFAERAIDGYLNGELTRRHALGLYPGPFGTSETLVVSSEKRIRGAIILGLGRQGQLNEFRLTSSVEQGVSKYLATLNHRPVGLSNGPQLPKRIGISALLVGSGYGGLRIDSAVRAVLQGVQNANAKIRSSYDSPRLVETVEFIELYKDRAQASMKAVSNIEKEENRSLNIIRTGTIRKTDGSRERLPIDDTTEWWTRITVRLDPDDLLLPDAQRNLQFSISTNAARQEEKSLRTLNATLTGMLEELSRKDNWSPELARAIFELMIPIDFKQQIKRQNNIVWILDKYTAAFPWELLQDSTTDALPLSVNAGMVRQLATGNFRLNINPVAESTAIVIGDPNLEGLFNQLPAAEKEGGKIAELLAVQGYEVTRLINSSAAQILRGLFSQNHKIVHLAGHGVFSPDPKQPTGMLIGLNAYLTPAYVEQMSSVPELVFVNCCYLGQADGAAEELSRSRFQLAANLGTQLIEIGVKAVIVAGWAVNDSAALDFAERFYQCLFEGQTFGEAVQAARKTVYLQSGGRNNTWGAYQCYGDPFYKLTASGDYRKRAVTYNFVMPEEAEIELSNLLTQIEGGLYDREGSTKQIVAIEQALERSKLSSIRITELRALIYSWLNEYERAIEAFNELKKEKKAAFSFSTTERYCDVQIQWRVQQVMKKTLDVAAATTQLNEVITDLQALMRFGETPERLSLVANAYKSLALIDDGQNKQAAYRVAANYYHQAFTQACLGDRLDTNYYPLTNWITIQYALSLSDKQSWAKNSSSNKEFRELLKQELDSIRQRDEDEKAYWDWVAEATLLLCQRLLGNTEVTFETILGQFTASWQQMGTEWLREAELEHLAFLEDALTMATVMAKVDTNLEQAQNSLTLISRLKSALTVMA